jgi:hypothetical protein
MTMDWEPWTSDSVRVFIYTVSGSDGMPENLVAQSDGFSNVLVQGWNVVAIPPTPLAAGEYWLGASLNITGPNYQWWHSSPSGGAFTGNIWLATPAPSDLGGQINNSGPNYSFRAICP